jgi:hypothetical protein
MTTRAGKEVYPEGPQQPKYSRDDCRFNALRIRARFSHKGGMIHTNHGKANRAQRRAEMKSAGTFRQRRLTAVVAQRKGQRVRMNRSRGQ